MRKFIPANPAAFVPLHFPRMHPRELRALVFKQPTPLALPPPDRLARVLSALIVFTILI